MLKHKIDVQPHPPPTHCGIIKIEHRFLKLERMLHDCFLGKLVQYLHNKLLFLGYIGYYHFALTVGLATDKIFNM